MKTLLFTVASFIYLTSFSQAPTIQWQKAYGGSEDDNLMSLKKTYDGGYILCGVSYSHDGDISTHYGNDDFWIVKINNLGNIEWEKSFGGSGFDGANSIEQTSDNGYIIAGYSSSTDGNVTNLHGSRDFWIVKINYSGNLEWQKTFGGTNTETATSIKQTTDNGYIVGGYSGSNNGDKTIAYGSLDYWALKLSTNGSIIWQKTIGGSNADMCTSVLQTNDNSYIIAGQSKSNDIDVLNGHGEMDYYIAKLDLNGNLEWQKTFGGTNSETLRDINQTSDNGFLLTGNTASSDGDITVNFGLTDLWIVKIDVTGNLDWQKSIGGAGQELGHSTIISNDGSYIIAGTAVSNDNVITYNGSFDYLIVKLNPLSVGIQESQLTNTFSVYPNPAKDFISISSDKKTTINSYHILDAIGNQVMSGKTNESNSRINISGLSSGMYFLQMGDDEKSTYKFIKE